MGIVVVANDEAVPLDLLEPLLPGARIVNARDGLPAFGSFDGLVVLGGRMSVEDTHQAPWLPALGHLMVDCASAGVPVLAICLGAQLLAVAGGGKVEVEAWAGPERGVIEVTLRPGAELDPTLGRVHSTLGVRFPAPSAHNDAVSELPPEAVWLASSAQYPFHAFRLGSALAVQFHPEAGVATMCGWNEPHGVAVDDLTAQMERHSEDLAALAVLIAEGFREEIAAARRRQL